MDFKKLSDFMDHLTGWRIPGCSCEVYLKGKPVFKYSSGYADMENKIKMDPENTRMFMYSISKIVTCVTAMTLWEEGKFVLDDPVSKFLPEWKETFVRESDGEGGEKIVPASREITMRDLFAMTSGLDYNCESPALLEARKALSPHCPSVELMRALAKDPKVFHPGDRWCYGLSHDVIGAVVEVITGKRLGQVAKERIFDPLGLKKTAYGLDERYRSEMAVQYAYSDEKGCIERPDYQDNWAIFGDMYDSGGAGVVSTVSEMAYFMSVLSMGGAVPGGTRIIGRKTLELMSLPMLTEAQEATMDWSHLPGYSYGLGVRTMKDPAKGGSPSPVGEFGWTGAAGAFALIDMENGLSMFYAHHMLNNQEWYTAPRLRNVLYSCID
ncbi:MAG: beta-lactamase family protein [Clostridia bacterium]|nr:beta-lactamase family protein [Clostridia bacterium]